MNRPLTPTLSPLGGEGGYGPPSLAPASPGLPLSGGRARPQRTFPSGVSINRQSQLSYSALQFISSAGCGGLLLSAAEAVRRQVSLSTELSEQSHSFSARRRHEPLQPDTASTATAMRANRTAASCHNSQRAAS